MRYASRKFIAAMSAMGSATWLVSIAGIEGTVYATVMSTVVVAYVAANVAQKATIVAEKETT
jgi:hypothetical protein